MELLNKHVTIRNFKDKTIEDQLLNNISIQEHRPLQPEICNYIVL